MARKFTVMGFTEAELGFVLAAFFAAVGVAYQQERAGTREELIAAQEEARVAKAHRDSAQAALDSIRNAHLALRDSIRGKSNLTPPCAEKGERDVPIAEIRVVSADRYLMQGVEMNWQELKAGLQDPIAKQKKLGCRYFVRVFAVPGVDAPVHAAATRPIRSLFYVRER